MSTGPHFDVAAAVTADGPAWKGFTVRGLLAFAGLNLVAALPLAAGWPASPMSPVLWGATVILGFALALLSAIDLETQRLPDVITLPLLVLGLAVATAVDFDLWALGWRIASAAFGYLVMWGVARGYLAMRGRHGLGLGDAKLMAAGGAWLGIEGLPTVLLIATFSALLVVAGAHVRGREITRETALPFGPFLAIGIWIVWLYGPIA